MKKIFILIALIAMTVAQAQEGKKEKRGERMNNATPQETATMQSKKMTLELDLSDQQEKEVYQVLLKQAENRKENRISREDREKLTDEQRKAMRTKAMDERIAMKRAMKNILNEEQYAEWEENSEKRTGRRGNGDKKK